MNMSLMNHTNIIILDKDWGVFLGSFENNLTHKHYAIQINIPLFEAVETIARGSIRNTEQALYIPSQLEHHINTKNKKPFLILLINPICLTNKATTITPFQTHEITNIQLQAVAFLEKKISLVVFEKVVRAKMDHFTTISSNTIDDRIKKAILLLRTNQDRIVSLSEIAKHCFLSESRFLHLFKSELGITYRRAQLWYRVSQSFTNLMNSSVTQTAYEFGFTDGAHYSKVFKENFGFSPKKFLKNSQFLQVLPSPI